MDNNKSHNSCSIFDKIVEVYNKDEIDQNSSSAPSLNNISSNQLLQDINLGHFQMNIDDYNQLIMNNSNKHL